MTNPSLFDPPEQADRLTRRLREIHDTARAAIRAAEGE